MHARSVDADRATRAYYVGYVVTLVLCFTPLKLATYLLPSLFVGWMMFSAPKALRRNAVVGLASAIGLVGVLYAYAAPEFILVNYCLALLTYSAWLPAILIDGRRLGHPNLLGRMLNATAIMVGVQGAVGVIQALYGVTQTGSFGGGNGDYVVGTINLQFISEQSFSNPIFAANMAVMIFGLLSAPDDLTRNRRLCLLLGLVALVLASVMHVLFFSIGAIIVALVMIRPARVGIRTRGRRVLLGTLLFGIVLTYSTLRGNLSAVASIVDTVTDTDSLVVPRSILIYRILTDLPTDVPLQPYIGVGPGQFSSRASLIATGMYLGSPLAPKPLPFGIQGSTRLTEDYCVSLLVAFAEQSDQIGSSQQPFFSWLSVYTELGIFGVIALVFLLTRFVRRIRYHGLSSPSLRLQATLLIASSIFVFLLGMQENYWEVPQAIFIGILLMKVIYANLITESNSKLESPSSLER